MTFVVTRNDKSRWNLTNIQFGLNEFASALTLAKSTGSIFSVQNDAGVFQYIEDACDVRVTSVPPWLEEFSIARATTVLGSKFQRVQGPQLLENVKINSIEGLCAVIVLCCKYAESVSKIVAMVEGFLTGGISSGCIDSGKVKDAQASEYKAWSPLLKSWIQAVQSADADSLQAQTTIGYLTELSQEGISTLLSSNFVRCHKGNLDIISDLLGYERTRPGHWESMRDQSNPEAKRRVFNTMSAGTASIGLAANANGADISVEIVKEKNGREVRTIIPRSTTKPTRYLIRLWLCHPPFEIYQHLDSPRRFSEAEDSGHIEAYSANIIFGGEHEIAMASAREMNYWTNSAPIMETRVFNLWNAGLQQGGLLDWKIKKYEEQGISDIRASPHLCFQLSYSTLLDVDHQVLELADAFALRRPRLARLSRVIANIVHQEYHLRKYEQYELEFYFKAMDFVVLAITIGCLQSLTQRPSKNFTYAFNLGALIVRGRDEARTRTGELYDLISEALEQGVVHTRLLWCGALIWGGASYISQGYQMISDRVIGIVAPQSTIILDFVRDPKLLAGNGFKKGTKLFSVHHGAVPVLGRDPISGFVLAAEGANGRPAHRYGLDCLAAESRYVDDDNLGYPPDDTKLLLTFEPNVSGTPSSNHIIGWYKGDLAFELDPLQIFHNLLLRRGDEANKEGRYIPPGKSCTSARMSKNGPAIRKRYLDYVELMRVGEFIVDNGIVVCLFNSDLAWTVACAGCAPRGSVVVLPKGLDFDNTHVTDVVVYI